MLFIEPTNGLANRMRVIDSGIALAKKLNTQLSVDWVLNKDLNCRFDHLFEPLEGVIMNDGIRLPYVFNRYVNLYYKYKSMRYDKAFYAKDPTSLREQLDQEEFMQSLKDVKKLYITTCQEFSSMASRDYSFFRPKPVISDTVEQMCDKLGRDFIGIHLRRTDSKRSVAQSPTELFEAKVKLILADQPRTRFFLSTDSAEDEQLLKNAFPENMLSYPKVLSRDNEKGIQDAMVDMLCLSRATKIFGSFYSSFSEAASYFSGNELIILKN
jgi:hypothetical protein